MLQDKADLIRLKWPQCDKKKIDKLSNAYTSTLEQLIKII